MAVLRMIPIELDIRGRFDGYISALFKQKCQIADAITQWNNTLIQHIQAHANQQRKLLEQEYSTQLDHLTKACDQALEETRVWAEMNAGTELSQLLERCDRLKIELSTITYPERTIQTIQLMKAEQQLNSSNVSTSTHECSENNVTNGSNTADNSLSKSTTSSIATQTR